MYSKKNRTSADVSVGTTCTPNVQEKLYEFEQNKKNNLIFHGILAEHPETSDG